MNKTIGLAFAFMLLGLWSAAPHVEATGQIPGLPCSKPGKVNEGNFTVRGWMDIGAWENYPDHGIEWEITKFDGTQYHTTSSVVRFPGDKGPKLKSMTTYPSMGCVTKVTIKAGRMVPFTENLHEGYVKATFDDIPEGEKGAREYNGCQVDISSNNGWPPFRVTRFYCSVGNVD